MVMTCPVCQEWRRARDWSPVQKCHRDPRAKGCDGWERNCCKHCQDVPGWYYTTRDRTPKSRSSCPPAKPPAAPPAPPAAPPADSYNTTFTSSSPTWPPLEKELQRQKDWTTEWLRRNIDDSFWLRVHSEFCNINLLRRAEMVAINRALGLKDEKSFLKHASYLGAIHVPNDFPDNLIDFIDKKSGDRFIDPGNWVYCYVFKRVWPNVAFMSNPETVGDLLEAILGLAWVMNERGQTLSPVAEDFLQILEQACLSEYSLQTWYPNRA